PELVGETLDGLGEGEVVDRLQEGDDVAALPAAEAVVGPHGGSHVEAGRLLVVEGAQPLERPHPGPSQRHVLTHDPLDGGALLDGLDVLRLDPRHGAPPLPGQSRRRTWTSRTLVPTLSWGLLHAPHAYP